MEAERRVEFEFLNRRLHDLGKTIGRKDPNTGNKNFLCCAENLLGSKDREVSSGEIGEDGGRAAMSGEIGEDGSRAAMSGGIGEDGGRGTKDSAGSGPAALFGGLRTPAFVIDEAALRHNLEILHGVQQRTGAKILLAQKAFSNYDFYPLIAEYISGTEASGLYESRLGSEKMPGLENHVFCAAYREDEFEELLRYADHIVFNTPAQLAAFGPRAKAAGKSLGLRINPECSTQEGHAIYDPCAPGSRLGTTRAVWNQCMTPELVALLDGLHFHTLCEQNADALAVTLRAVEAKFGDVLPAMKWLNMGGGHHITREDYDISLLEDCVRYASEKWNLQVYLEPGEAIALNAGYLVTRVLDIVENGREKIAVLDASAACHMPDVIEMPYTPPLFGARAAEQEPGSGPTKFPVPGSPSLPDSRETKWYRYTLGGPTCLSGDIIGTYSFDHRLNPGELLVFGDMAIYTTCKTNTFNGMPLPDILRLTESGRFRLLRRFGYDDFAGRLGAVQGG